MLLSMAVSRSTFRWAVCSETFAGMRFSEACLAAARCGYSGIEVEPAHLGPDPVKLPASARNEIRQWMKAAGLQFTGFHNALKAPVGLHVTTSDAALRARSWDYFRGILDLAADLGTKPLIAFGSSRQRNALDGVTPADATKRLAEGLSGIASQAKALGVTIALEPLAPHLCNVIHTLDEAMSVLNEVKSPALRSMFDTHNAVAEKLAHGDVIRKYRSPIRHVHLNELDGRYPGAADYPFLPVLQALKDIRYRGWVSVEVFDFKPDGETVARRAMEHLRSLEGNLR
jgi:D-psicose/D-tagatose/L-ribulose 3-epimerase